MNKKWLCDIPIYAMSEHRYNDKLNRLREKYFRLNNSGSIDEYSKSIANQNTRPYSIWKYNEMVGFIEIYVDGFDIIFDYYLADFERYNCFSSKKKHIMLYQPGYDHLFTDGKTNDEIINDLKDSLNNIIDSMKNYKKDLYYDFSMLDNVVKYIDLRKFVEDANKWIRGDINELFLSWSEGVAYLCWQSYIL